MYSNLIDDDGECNNYVYCKIITTFVIELTNCVVIMSYSICKKYSSLDQNLNATSTLSGVLRKLTIRWGVFFMASYDVFRKHARVYCLIEHHACDSAVRIFSTT